MVTLLFIVASLIVVSFIWLDAVDKFKLKVQDARIKAFSSWAKPDLQCKDWMYEANTIKTMIDLFGYQGAIEREAQAYNEFFMHIYKFDDVQVWDTVIRQRYPQYMFQG